MLWGIVLPLAGCATQDQLRQTEEQQGNAVQALKADADRSESVISDLRAEIKRTQKSVHGLEVALTEARARADAAKGQADSALSTSREFLANLLTVREEQRRQLDENGVAFAGLRRTAADLESRLQAQQRLIDQGAVAFNNAIRRLSVIEAGLQDAVRRATLLEAQAKTGQEADNGLARQLATLSKQSETLSKQSETLSKQNETLSKQVEQTRSVISSEGLLQMMRELEDVRRNSASLRGSIEELQQAQVDAATKSRNFYVDLDTRIQALKKVQTDFATQDRTSNLDLDTRIQALSKAQADFATQDKKLYLDLDTRIRALSKAQADSAQDKNSYLDLNTRIQALSKTQTDFAAQQKNLYFDLDTRIQALKKAQVDFATQDKNLYLDLDTRIQALIKAQADFAAQARAFYLDFDSRIQALKQNLPAPGPEGKVSIPAAPLPATTSISPVAPTAEAIRPVNQ